MNLSDAIRQQGNTGSDADVLAWLTADVEIRRDESLKTNRSIREACGDDAEGLALVLETIHAAEATNPLVRSFGPTLRTTGINFADSLTQAMIDQMAVAGGWPDELRDRMKEMGIVRGTRWQSLQVEAEPDGPAVALARSIIAAESFLARVVNEVLWPAVREGASIAEMKSRVQALE